MKKQLKKKFNINYITILLAIFCLFSFLPITAISSTKAEETIYSNVLDDLQKDENFNIEDYPLKENDYTLQVIQIAESNDKELFIYVYQPSGEKEDLIATSINFSTSKEDLFFIKYGLSLIHSTSVFYKYKVEEFVVSDEEERVYNISSIFRKWESKLDDPANEGQTISEVSFGVSQIWTAITENNNVIYEREDTQTIQIDSKYVGFIRYTTSFVYWLTGTACDSHFVAFSADHQIDQLYEADISYVRYTYKKTEERDVIGGGIGGGGIIQGPKYEYGPDIPVTKSLTYTQEVEVGFITKFEWNRIEKVSDFLSEEYISEYIKDDAKANIREKDWVLRFYESDYRKWSDSVGVVEVANYEEGERVKDVTLLRLKFKTGGDIYNLGVIDNVQTGSDEPSNNLPNPRDWLYRIWAIILGLISFIFLFSIIWPFMPSILSFLWTCIKTIFKALWWLIQKIAIGIWWVFTSPFEVFND